MDSIAAVASYPQFYPQPASAGSRRPAAHPDRQPYELDDASQLLSAAELLVRLLRVRDASKHNVKQ